MKVELDMREVQVNTVVLWHRQSSSTVTGYGISRRAAPDRLNRKLGRTIAAGRAIKALTLKLRGRPVRSVFMG
jgi:hypothetical protein